MQFTPLQRTPQEFQQPITAVEFAALCQRAFGTAVEIIGGRELPSGKFNTTFLVTLANQQVILRLGPHPTAEVFANEYDLLRREYALQPYFGAISELAPRTLFADFSRELVVRDYVFQQFLPGELWDDIADDLTASENNRLWIELAHMNAIIQAEQ